MGAFNGELEELKRMKDENILKKIVFKRPNRSVKWNVTKEFIVKHINAMRDDINISSTNLKMDKAYELTVQLININVYIFNPWDDTAYNKGATPAMFALSNGHYNIVQWLESEKLAKKHKEIFEYTKMDEELARYYIDPYNEYWGEPSNDLS